MSKLIEKEGQFYKECGVVMLESNKENNLYLRANLSETILCRSSIAYKQQSFPNQQNQHLYITSDDEIKEGDWVYHNTGYVSIVLGFNLDAIKLIDAQRWTEDCKKIIATTDTSLYINAIFEQDMHMYQKGLPQPSDKFIQAYIDAYNKGEKIKKVLVELEMYAEDITNFINYKPKLKDNNIIIKKVKDSWSRAEVETSHLSMAVDIAKHILEGNSFTTFNPEKWIEENI